MLDRGRRLCRLADTSMVTCLERVLDSLHTVLGQRGADADFGSGDRFLATLHQGIPEPTKSAMANFFASKDVSPRDAARLWAACVSKWDLGDLLRQVGKTPNAALWEKALVSIAPTLGDCFLGYLQMPAAQLRETAARFSKPETWSDIGIQFLPGYDAWELARKLSKGYTVGWDDVAFAALDVVSFIPGGGIAAKAGKAGKVGKSAEKGLKGAKVVKRAFSAKEVVRRIPARLLRVGEVSERRGWDRVMRALSPSVSRRMAHVITDEFKNQLQAGAGALKSAFWYYATSAGKDLPVNTAGYVGLVRLQDYTLRCLQSDYQKQSGVESDYQKQSGVEKEEQANDD